MLGDDLANRPTRHPRSRVLRLRGLPYRAVEEDIHQFFAPVVVARIYVCRRNGRTTGEAYAEFEDSAQAGEALRVKNRQHLGNRYIELFEAGQSDLERLIATETRAHAAASLQSTPPPAIKVVGLPATASRQDIVNFFSGIEIPHGVDSVTFISERDTSPSAVVQLASAQAQLQALSRSNTLLGATLVQVVPLDAVEAAVNSAALAASSVPFTAQQQGLVSSSQHAQPVSSQQSFPIDTSGATLKLRGLPYSADESDVIAFFEGFEVGPNDVHLEVRSDHPSQRTGRQYLPRGSVATASRPAVWPQYQPPPLPFLLPASAAFPFNAALPLQGAPFAGNAAADQQLQSAGWSRPFRGLDARPFSPLLYSSAQAMRSSSGSLRHSSDQASGATESRSGDQDGAVHPPAMQTAEAGPGGPHLPFGLTTQQQQQQQLMLQQHFAIQQQQQLLMQQQALQAQWGNLQQGGWLRAFPPMPLGLAPGGPLQMPPRGPLQGGMGMPGQPLAYYAPGTPFGWTTMHPGQATMVGQGIQQPPRPLFRPGHLGPEQRQTVHSPFDARTPGRGRFRTPFTLSQPTPSALQQDSRFDQPLAGNPRAVQLPGGASGPAATSAMVSDSALSMAATVSDMDRLSLKHDLAAAALRPVNTHVAPSPSDIIRASAARGRSPEGDESASAGFPLLSDPAYSQSVQGAVSHPLQVPGLSSTTVEEVNAVSTSSLRSAVSSAMLLASGATTSDD